jgi:hypothetical protein
MPSFPAVILGTFPRLIKYSRRFNNSYVLTAVTAACKRDGVTRDLDNRFVVAYNAALLTEFNCHMNVEVCASIKSVKYIYKYVSVGHITLHSRPLAHRSVGPPARPPALPPHG